MPVPLAAAVFNQQSRPFPPRAGGGTICAKFRGAWRPRRSPQHSSTKNCSFPARTGAPDRKQALSKIPAAEKTAGQNLRPTNAENIMTQRTQQSHITQTARERTAKARIRDAPHTVHATKPSFARKIPFSTYKLQTGASASILPSALRNNRATAASEIPPASTAALSLKSAGEKQSSCRIVSLLPAIVWRVLHPRATFYISAAKSGPENPVFQPFLPENSLSKPLLAVYNGNKR